MKKRDKIIVLTAAILIVIFAGVLILFNGSIERTPLRPTGGNTFAKATVLGVLSDNTSITEDGELLGNQTIKIKITSGEYKGEECEATSPNSNHSGAYCKKGTKVIILVNEGDNGEIVATVYNYDRALVLLVLVGLFIVVLCLIGGKQGAASVIGLIFTFVCIFGLYIPMMYIGVSPFLAATLTSILVTIVVMLLIGGWSYKTLCAIIGTIAGVMVAGGLAAIFGYFGHISGLNVDDVETLAYIAQNSELDVGGILFSGILIASLGAIMDVGMSVSSTIAEIHETNPGIGRKQLFKSGINVGKDMMGTMSNTLILAFAGSSINSLIILYAYNMSSLEYMNRYDIGIELLRGITGSLGVILTVPLVSFIESFLMAGRKE